MRGHGGAGRDTAQGGTVRYPTSGFLDRVTKELVINVVSLLNRSRYSMTHHTVIGYNTLSELLPHPDPDTRAEQAEAMLLHLVDDHGNPTFDRPGAPTCTDTPAYHNAYATGMLVELTWLTVHFSGLLNVWFTVLHTFDEASAADDEIDFITVYNTTVPAAVRRRNNALLGATGWGDRPLNGTGPAPAVSSVEALTP
ncbi:hypothetical protein AB0A63_40380 [Lentzea sp. NPDC042327]|uniref:hypothetical protein n=1 Tax=Lentzea sp. NPDC042327 TaxID=3154801 RepID=UPI0033D6F2F2